MHTKKRDINTIITEQREVHHKITASLRQSNSDLRNKITELSQENELLKLENIKLKTKPQ